jgi:deoxyribodipyrimidine photo-lyase
MSLLRKTSLLVLGIFLLAGTLCPDYPLPLIDHKTASKQAKDEIFGRRKLAVARLEAQGVYLRHGSRSGPRSRQISRKRTTPAKASKSQLLLDLNF